MTTNYEAIIKISARNIIQVIQTLNKITKEIGEKHEQPVKFDKVSKGINPNRNYTYSLVDINVSQHDQYYKNIIDLEIPSPPTSDPDPKWVKQNSPGQRPGDKNVLLSNNPERVKQQ